MRVWILLALALSSVVALSQQNQDVAMAHQVSPMDSGLDNTRRLQGNKPKSALKALWRQGASRAERKDSKGDNAENPKVFSFEDDKKGRYGMMTTNFGETELYRKDRKTGGKFHYAGGFKAKDQ
ncbi:hypothetical protein LEN26_011971 [Aphanomyces euteiches]|nr:hypothetical protein LEN26_011971 [Aphanomyces euteiches]